MSDAIEDLVITLDQEEREWESVNEIASAARAEIKRLRSIIAELLKACEKLDELDWCIGYELVEQNQVILDKAVDMARKAIAHATPTPRSQDEQ